MLTSMFMDDQDHLPTLRFLEAIMQIVCEWSVDRSSQLRDIEKNQLTDNPISKPSENSSTKGETAKPNQSKKRQPKQHQHQNDKKKKTPKTTDQYSQKSV